MPRRIALLYVHWTNNTVYVLVQCRKTTFLRHFDKNAKIITFDTFLKIFEGLKIGCRGTYCIPRIYDALCEEVKAGGLLSCSLYG